MNRLLIFMCSVGVLVGCAKDTQAKRADEGAAQPVAVAEKASTPTGTTGTVATAPAAEPGASQPEGTPTGREQDYREITIPAGTVLPVNLETSVGSDTSRVEQPVRGALRRALVVKGVEVLPAGTAISGHVTAARRPGRVKGRGYVALRFNQLDTPGAGTTRITTASIGRLAPATKQKDAAEIVGGAAAGAVIGRIAGGKGAARKGAVIGGAGGTGYVLSTRGKNVRIARGSNLAVRLTAPLTVRVPVKG